MKVSAIISGLAVALVAMGVNAVEPKSKAQSQEAQAQQSQDSQAQQSQDAQAQQQKEQAAAPGKASAKQ